MIVGILLAAGASSRMGEIKPLLQYRGKSFLAACCTYLLDGGVDSVVVVLGDQAEAIQPAVPLDSRIRLAWNPTHAKGQLSSLQVGLGLLPPETIAAVVTLVDHPAITGNTVGALLQAFWKSGKPIVIPTFGGHRGHPVLFARAVFGELLGAPPEQGAKAVVRQDPGRVALVPVSDEGILLDIDTPEAYARLTASEHKQPPNCTKGHSC